MLRVLTRRDFIKTASPAALSMAVPVEVFAAEKIKADLVVYGKIFTAENNKIVDEFAVKDGKFIYVGEKSVAKAFIGSNTVLHDHSGKGLVMPACGNGHAHYMLGYALSTVGTMLSMDDTPNKFMTEILPATVKKAKETGSTTVFGQGWNLISFQRLSHEIVFRQRN